MDAPAPVALNDSIRPSESAGKNASLNDADDDDDDAFKYDGHSVSADRTGERAHARMCTRKHAYARLRTKQVNQ